MDNKAITKLGYGLYILTAKDGEKDNGCIVNTVMQVTSSPDTTLVIAVNKKNYTHDIIMKTKKCNVSVLTEETPFDVFKRFGYQSGKETDKFDGFDCPDAENGVKYIDRYTNAYITCDVLDAFDFGSHTLFKVKVDNAVVLSDKSTVTYDYYQNNIKPKTETKPLKEGGKVGWLCTVCGYIYEGEELPSDFVCPLCKHGAADFIKINI